MTRLAGHVAWITGGGTGIGAVTARTLARAGAEVVVSGIDQAPLDATANQIRRENGRARTALLDVTDSAAVDAVALEIGRIDILVTSAGTNVTNRALSTTEASAWDQVIDVNLNGCFYSVRAALPSMRQAGGGTIILISSMAGRLVSRMTGAAYNASKRAVIALAETVNAEESNNGVRCTALLPGETATEILKLRPQPPSEAELARMLDPQDLADTARFIAEMPPRCCINEIVVTPTWNRFAPSPPLNPK